MAGWRGERTGMDLHGPDGPTRTARTTSGGARGPDSADYGAHEAYGANGPYAHYRAWGEISRDDELDDELKTWMC